MLRLTLGQALRLTAFGLGCGSLLAWAAGRALASALRGAVSLEAGLLAAMAAILAGAAVVAALIPARRALAVDPARALRSE